MIAHVWITERTYDKKYVATHLDDLKKKLPELINRPYNLLGVLTL